MQVFRIVTRRRVRDAFTGEGARRFAGRWNPKGVAAVYTAESRSLALLEMLVQDDPLRALYWVIPAEIPHGIEIERIETKNLPTDWIARIEVTRALGAAWIARSKTAVLAVPSAVVQEEKNFLLNPRHPTFGRIRIGRPSALETDLRLLRKIGMQ